MILMLDAHALVWWLDDDATLSAGARAAITDPANDVVISAATVWELAIRRATGRIRLPEDLPAAIEMAGFSSLAVTAVDAEAAAALPPHHRDPFDRMLVAQAARLQSVIVSRDGAFEAYGADILPA